MLSADELGRVRLEACTPATTSESGSPRALTDSFAVSSGDDAHACSSSADGKSDDASRNPDVAAIEPSWLDELTVEERRKLKSKLELESLDSHSIRPELKYLADFPDWLDELFREFDDDVIKAFQKHTEHPVYAVSWFFSALTSIESALWMPFVLFSLGYDSAATVMTNVLLVLSLISQVPKRFLWRPRPWMLRRAKGVRKDPTSSFPSRGVTCAVVFPVMILFALEQELAREFSLLLYVFAVLLTVTFTTFARINVGAHYPSDVLGGLVLGTVVLTVSFMTLRLWSVLGCMSSAVRYPVASGFQLRRETFWALVSAKQLLACTLISFMVALVSGISPIRFWLKNNYVYGLLLSSLTFRFVFVCPSCSPSGVGLSAVASPSFWVHAKTILTGGLMIAVSFALKPKRRGVPEWAVNAQRLLKFLLMYCATLVVMVHSRLTLSSV